LLWPQIEGVEPTALIACIADFAADYGCESAADLCLAYARGQSWIAGVVVGMETEDQLDTNLRLAQKPALTPAQCAQIAARVPRVPQPLLDPAQWPPRTQ
jgi:aryl-alcohol dehydrogenase-like predicted oxidoreductase